MSKLRLCSSYGSIAVTLAVATRIAVGSFPLVGPPRVIADGSANIEPRVTVLQNPPTSRFQIHRGLPPGGAVRGLSLPVPPDPHELATGSIQPAVSPDDRAAAFALLFRAAQNGKMHIRTMPPYELKTSFVAGNAQQTGSGELTETWLNGQNWRWTANLGGYSIVRIGSRGQIADAQPVSTIPMRIQMMRNAIFWADRIPGPNAMIRIAAAQWNGKTMKCLLTSNMPPVAGSTRLWEEEERCIDDASGLLQVYSVAPGTSVIYGYGGNQQFHGRAVPDQITAYAGGNVALDAQVSLTDSGSSVDANLFTITPDMAEAGSAITLLLDERFPLNVGDVSGTARPVIVHATIDGNGNVIEEELSAASDPRLAQPALDLVKKTTFGPSGATQRDAYINVRFGN